MKIVSRINKSLKILSLTAALGVGFSLPAFALDGDAFFARVQTEMKKSGYDIKAGKISVDGANVNVSDVKIIETEASNEKAVAIKEINFQDVEEDKDGGYLVGRTVIDEFRDDTSSNIGQVGTINGVEITKMLLKSEKNEAAYEGTLPFGMISVKKVAYDENGKSTITVDDLSFGYSEYEVGKLLKFGGELGNLKVHLENLPNDKEKEALTKMGFNQLDIQGNYKFAANLVDGHVDVTFQGNMNDAGQLNITISLAGLTKDLADELVRLTSEANTATDKQQQIIAMSIVGLIQQLSLNSIDIKFVDNSITNKIIDLQKEPDMKREDFVTQLKMFSSFGLMSLQHPDFAEKVSTEIGKYLDNPENIEITAKPDHSTPFAVITSTAMTSKKDLIDLLKVDVKANQ
ncbi:hypothetical protein N5853_07245 [Bartonella sp. HY329]|uniref:hypothetical protein n=1 Tax=unclassified Bartonella TaxID=2645622 RepID=UPI0021CA2F54|nr:MULTISPECIES: hypothetical protein [unclassified Bartonella]UXM93927.1 hypothetical protein N5853_07245 [Bartonella sp. HY329]UXN08248.1 hypothetical protein N5852_07255 [Bartonella sp. HY328]